MARTAPKQRGRSPPKLLPQQRPTPLIVISVLNWNGWEDTHRCLQSIRGLEYPNYLIALVDNGSSDDSVDRIKAWAGENLSPNGVFADYTRAEALLGGLPEIENALDDAPSRSRMVLIRNEKNLGFTGGNNICIQYALTRNEPSDFVFLLNNDARVSSSCLSNLLLATEKARAGIAEATIFSDGGPDPHPPCRPPRWHMVLDQLVNETTGPFDCDDDYCEAIVARGAAVLIRGAVLHKIFSERGDYLRRDFFMYQEDCELSLRVRKLGYRCIRGNNATVWHDGAGASGGKYGALEYYYTHRNRLLFARETSLAGWVHAHLNTVKALGRIAKCLLLGRVQSARAIASGVVDGYRGVTGKWERHDSQHALREAQTNSAVCSPRPKCHQGRTVP